MSWENENLGLESDPINESYVSLINSGDNLLAAAKNLSLHHTDAYVTPVSEAMLAYDDAFENAVSLILEEGRFENIAEKRDRLEELFRGSYTFRIEGFKELAPSEGYSEDLISDEDLGEEIEAVLVDSNSPDEAKELFLEEFRRNLVQDMNVFLSLTPYQTVEDKSTKRDWLAEHSADIGKIAAGTALGILIVQGIDAWRRSK